MRLAGWQQRSGRTAAVLVLLALAGCGGGGGGGESPGQLSLGAPTPTKASFQVAEGANTDGLSVSAQVSGDLAQLSGKTLYVVVTDPLGLFHDASLSYDAASARATVSLRGRQQTVPGSRSGLLSLRVCWDAACVQPAAAAPLSLAYDVVVRTGLKVSPAQVLMQAPFGSLPAVTTVAVQVPEGQEAGDYRFSLLPPAGGSAHGAMSLQRTADGRLQVLPRLMLPGRYESTAYVEATAPAKGSQPAQPYGFTLPLVYEVAESNVEWAFAPSSLALSTEFGNPVIVPVQVDHVARSGYFTLDSWRYDPTGEPADAAGSPLHNRWLSLSGSTWYAFACSSGDCLPRGNYRAVLVFGHRIEGVATGTRFELPLNFEVR